MEGNCGSLEGSEFENYVYEVKLAGQGVGISLDRRRDKPVYVPVVSVNVPMFRALVEQKEQFLSDLQAKLNSANEHDVLLLVGDFNARVGRREDPDRAL